MREGDSVYCYFFFNVLRGLCPLPSPSRDVSLSELREASCCSTSGGGDEGSGRAARAEKGAADKAAKEAARCRHFSTMLGGTAPAVASA